MTIEKYLQSKKAIEDVRSLASWVGRGGGKQGPIFLSCMGIADGPGPGARFRILDWNKMGIEHTTPYVHWVYLRSEGDRFIVSDLGEGLRAYALRTGDVEHRSLPGAFPSSGVLGRDGRLFACTLRGDSVCLGIEPADLPAAIVRVMLASYRLANSEVPAP